MLQPSYEGSTKETIRNMRVVNSRLSGVVGVPAEWNPLLSTAEQITLCTCPLGSPLLFRRGGTGRGRLVRERDMAFHYK
jgi:hypothetical protein